MKCMCLTTDNLAQDLEVDKTVLMIDMGANFLLDLRRFKH